MSKATRYSEEFKLAAIKWIMERAPLVAEVVQRLGVSGHARMPGSNTPTVELQQLLTNNRDARRALDADDFC